VYPRFIGSSGRGHGCGNLSSRQELLGRVIFAEFNDLTLKDTAEQLALLKGRLEKATFKLAADI
jgi:hypothetical protein